MITTTLSTSSIKEGRVLGIVTGHATAMAAGMNVPDKKAIKAMENEAEKMGANAVIDTDLKYLVVDGVLHVYAVGTAVILFTLTVPDSL